MIKFYFDDSVILGCRNNYNNSKLMTKIEKIEDFANSKTFSYNVIISITAIQWLLERENKFVISFILSLLVLS